MAQKTAYLWGPLSSFSGPLTALLVAKGWHVHIATKSALNIFSLSPLDLLSSGLAFIERCMGSHDHFRAYQDRIKFTDETEIVKGTTYDAIIFCGLPPNFDEPRVPRAPWAASRLPQIAKSLKGVPIVIVSSIWGGIQKDGVVPEEFEFERRKPITQWESACQFYEQKLLDSLSHVESSWCIVRVPMISGSAQSGEPANFTGPYHLFGELAHVMEGSGKMQLSSSSKILKMNYHPDSTLWFLPVDLATLTLWRFLEDENRPRICNLVSTQATLNREWLQYLAQALGYEEVIASESDKLSLPGTLRKMLLDDVQIRTRNLFEASGRYQLSPVRLDKDYFDKVVAVGRAMHWGHPPLRNNKTLTYSQRLAKYYFECFVPSHFDESLLKKAAMDGTTIGFVLTGADRRGWILKAASGNTVVERLDPAGEKPSICFRFSGSTMTRLIQSRLSLHRALLLKRVEVERTTASGI